MNGMPPPPPRRSSARNKVPDGAPIPPMVEYDYRPGIDMAPAYDELDQLFADIKDIKDADKAHRKAVNQQIAKGTSSGLSMDDGPGFC